MKNGLRDRRLFTILMIVFVQIFGAAMVLPVLPLYAQREFNLRPEIITLLVSSFFAAQFLAGPLIGRLSDRYGRLPVLIISQIGTVISFILLIVAQSAGMLFYSRILDGITGGNIIVAQAYITDISPREKRTQYLGLIFAAFGLGFIIGPALGGILSAAFGEKIPFLVAAIAAAGTVILTWLVLDETVSPEQREASRTGKQTSFSPGELLRNVPLVMILSIAFVGQFALGIIQSTFALFGEAVLFAGYSKQTTDLGIGLLLSVVGVSQVITQTALLPRFLKLYSEATLVVIGSILRTISLLVFAVVTAPWWAIIGLILLPMGLGVATPSLQSLSTNTVPDDQRGGVLGLFQSINSLSVIISTAIGGVLFAITPATPYWVGMILSALVILPALYLVRQFQPKVETTPSNV
ncbi:MAG: MFS transporter [Anaerolineae bacterium]|nr:MFS transporter [Anaerolineae bacterium]